MLTATHVASLLGISTRKIYELHAEGALRGFRFGRAIRFTETDVEAYRESCRSTASRTITA